MLHINIYSELASFGIFYHIYKVNVCCGGGDGGGGGGGGGGGDGGGGGCVGGGGVVVLVVEVVVVAEAAAGIAELSQVQPSRNVLKLSTSNMIISKLTHNFPIENYLLFVFN